MIEFIIWASVTEFCNILDTITTWIGLYKLPKELVATETNPVARKDFKQGHFRLFNILKHVAVIGCIVWLYYHNNINDLKFLCLVLVLVVINNSYVVLSRIITHKIHRSGIYNLGKLIKIPDKFIYLFTVVVLWGLSFVIVQYGLKANIFI